MTYSFVWCASKRVNKMKKENISNWSCESIDIRNQADKLSMTAAARLVNKYSNKSTPRGNSCAAALNFSFIRTLIKTWNVARMSSRYKRGNNLRIKITLGRKLRRGFFVFQRGWFTRFSRCVREEKKGRRREDISSGFAVSLISLDPMAAFFLFPDS